MSFAGVHLPVTTPFDPARGDLDVRGFEANLRHWLTRGVTGVLVAGSTGEAPLLDEQELTRLTERARSVLDGAATVMVGTGAESTRATIRACRAAAAAGGQAVLVRPPSYYRARMTIDALRLHFLEVADACPVPVLLYHVPKFVPVELAPELVGSLATHPNVVGVKDSSGDLQNLGALCAACEGNAEVLVGAGTHLYPGLEVGAVGGIVAVGLLAAEAAVALHQAFRAGRAAEAGRLQERIGPLHRRVVAGTGVAGIKYGLDLLGLTGGPPRPPLLPLTAAERGEVEQALEAAGLRGPAGS